MATVKIHAIKHSPALALDYIENPEKTEQQRLVSGYNVDPLSASIEFAMTVALSKEINGDYTKTGGANNKAYHMIQSFAPFDNITPEKAHEIGIQWADEALEGKYEYVIATHVDKEQIHNHIIFNATSFYDHKKFRSVPYKTIARFRNISDRLCEENNLFVPRFRRRGKSERNNYHHGVSQKEKLEFILNTAISQCSTYTEFESFLAVMRVEVKKQKKNISFRLPGNTRFCRGKSIGEGFTFENIIKRLAEPDKALPRTKTNPKARRSDEKSVAEALSIILAEGLSDYNGIEDKISSLLQQLEYLNKNIAKEKAESEKLQRVAKYLKVYQDYLPIAQARAGKLIGKGNYDLRYENELRAFHHAATQLEKLGINPNVDIEKILTLIKEENKIAKKMRGKVSEISERISNLEKAKRTIEMISTADTEIQDIQVSGAKKKNNERGSM